VTVEHSANSGGQISHQFCRVEDRAEHLERQLVTGKVAQHHEGAAEANVESYAEPVSCLDVKESRLSASRSLPGSAFIEKSFADQLVNQDADYSPSHFHPAGKVGAGNRLMLPNQVQRNPAIDIPRSGSGRNVEIVRIDFTHLVVS
jgi:hypothetical protein